MLKQPETKYRPFPPVNLVDRQWPSRTITTPPVWMSTDLRDGNQSLFEPMNGERKMRMFRTLCQIGFKEIEVAFPSASQTDFDFVRKLIEGDHIPDDVTIEVLTQAREHLIRRTMESLRGARRAIVHVYNATSQPFRDIVFGMSKAEVVDMVVSAVTLIKTLAAEQPETEWVLEYSPETFTATELDFALEVCDAVTAAWGATPWVYMFKARVTMSTLPVRSPLPKRQPSTRSAPGLDFSDINAVARTVEHCNQLPIHPRHPYVGDLVFTAFSGSHQDAIKKGFAAQQADNLWNVPYLPIDPADVGRSYDSVIRVNSQSGKGGVAYLMESEYGVVMPRRLQVEFSAVVQQHTDTHGGEVSAADIWALFSRTYLTGGDDGESIELSEPNALRYVEHHLYEQGNAQGIRITVVQDGVTRVLDGVGNGPVDAAIHALKLPVEVRAYEERSMGAGADSRACAFFEVACQRSGNERFGVGIDDNIVTASIKALVSGINRLMVCQVLQKAA